MSENVFFISEGRLDKLSGQNSLIWPLHIPMIQEEEEEETKSI